MNFAPTHKMYFIAIVCPQEVDNKVLQFKLWMNKHFGSVAALKSPSHITLIQPFWMDERREDDLKTALQAFRSDMDELEIKLEGFSHFGKRVLFARVRENRSLEELKNQAADYFTGSFGEFIKKDDRSFHPHITIANRDLKPGDFEKGWYFLSKKSFKEKFFTKTISLLKHKEGNWYVIGEKQW